MIKTNALLNYEYRSYTNIPEKIATEVKRGNLIKVKRGLYITDINTNPFIIANNIVTPSYISYETALAYYGLIPERVYLIKSACFKKNKIKLFKTKVGNFYYQDIYDKAYPYGIDIVLIDNVNVSIACPEKALLDMISVISPKNNIEEIKELLFDDLRVNEMAFDDLDKKKLCELASYYISRNVKLFAAYLEEYNDK